jgi:hypothetical protein
VDERLSGLFTIYSEFHHTICGAIVSFCMIPSLERFHGDYDLYFEHGIRDLHLIAL